MSTVTSNVCGAPWSCAGHNAHNWELWVCRTALESVFLFEGQMKEPQNEEQVKKRDI